MRRMDSTLLGPSPAGGTTVAVKGVGGGSPRSAILNRAVPAMIAARAARPKSTSRKILTLANSLRGPRRGRSRHCPKQELRASPRLRGGALHGGVLLAPRRYLSTGSIRARSIVSGNPAIGSCPEFSICSSGPMPKRKPAPATSPKASSAKWLKRLLEGAAYHGASARPWREKNKLAMHRGCLAQRTLPSRACHRPEPIAPKNSLNLHAPRRRRRLARSAPSFANLTKMFHVKHFWKNSKNVFGGLRAAPHT
jgi:hypothetical protein